MIRRSRQGQERIISDSDNRRKSAQDYRGQVIDMGDTRRNMDVCMYMIDSYRQIRRPRTLVLVVMMVGECLVVWLGKGQEEKL